VITGTNRGLGFEYVKQYAADGWCVFAACRHPTSVDSLRLLAERSKGLVEVVAMDVTDLRSVKQAAAQRRRRRRSPHQQRRHCGQAAPESWECRLRILGGGFQR
jgi:NAD(P)-dependent dehydrogenase (short-subunit alcohol dehydrogenase family)